MTDIELIQLTVKHVKEGTPIPVKLQLLLDERGIADIFEQEEDTDV